MKDILSKEQDVKPVKIEEKKLSYNETISALKQYFLDIKNIDKHEFQKTIETSKFKNSDFFKIEPQTYSINLLKLIYESIISQEKDPKIKEYKTLVLKHSIDNLQNLFPEKTDDKNKSFYLFMAYVIGLLEVLEN